MKSKNVLLDSPDGQIFYFPNFFPNADELLIRIQEEINFESEQILMFGKKITVPRLIAWHGEPNIHYRYSGTDHITKPWTVTLIQMRNLLSEQLNAPFNSVLINFYRDGHDYMSWHSDNEKEMGHEPTIASVSLGEARIFEFKQKHEKKAELAIDLEHGSLLVMASKLQQNYYHRLKKMPKRLNPRINLTFRQIY